MNSATVDHELNSLSPAAREKIKRDVLSGQRAILPFKYYSIIRCQFVRSGAGPFVWTLNPGDRVAFQYGIGQVPTVAGFDPTFGAATGSETNLQNPGQTVANQTVYIGGLAIELTSDSDPLLASLVFRNTWLEMSMNGQESIKIGKVEDFPGAGGLRGHGKTALRAPNQLESSIASGGAGADVTFATNGEALAGNYQRWHNDPLVWQRVGDGKDSNLSVTLKCQNAITFTSNADRAAIAVTAGVTSVGTAPAANPAATPGVLGTYVDLKVMLISKSVGPRSTNL